MVPLRWGRRRRLLNFGRCQVRHKEKKPEISRDVEVEVDQRMHEQSSTSHDSRKLQGSHKGKVILAEAREGFEQQSREKPGTTGTAQDACFGKGLQVVVVGVIDDFSVIESFVGRIHDLQRAECLPADGPGKCARSLGAWRRACLQSLPETGTRRSAAESGQRRAM